MYRLDERTSDLERENRWENYIFRFGVQAESFFPVSGEKGSLLYASQHGVGPGCGLVSSTQQGAFLSSLPRGGAPAAALNTGGE